jgi:SAM-dependent methyltransferase
VKGSRAVGLERVVSALACTDGPPPASVSAPVTEWDNAARHALARPYLDPRAAAFKRAIHLELLERWLPDLDGRVVLKTDLWEEGVAGDELLFALSERGARILGIDVSPLVVAAAERIAATRGVDAHFEAADVRRLPFATGSIDAVVSTSTLDHLETLEDHRAAVSELRRVIAPGGTLVLTLDNTENVTYGLLRVAAALGTVPFPLGRSAAMPDLERLVEEAGFEVSGREYLVPAPRVITTALLRCARLLPGRAGDAAAGGVIGGLESLGARAPRRFAAFVGVKATAPGHARGASTTEGVASPL